MPSTPRLLAASLATALLGAPAAASAGEPGIDPEQEGPAEPGPPASMLPPELEPAAASTPTPVEPEVDATPSAGAPPATDAPPTADARPRPSPTKRRRRETRREDAPLVEAPPRQLTVAVGWAHNAVDNLPDALVPTTKRPHGAAFQLVHLWQVGGLGRRWPTWVGVGLGVDVFPATAISRQVVALDVGLHVKHGLGRAPRVRPTLGYGVGAAQAFIKTIDGSGGGPQLRLAAGVDVRLRGAVMLSLELAYRIRWLPTFRQDGFEAVRWDFHTLSITAGVTFDLAPQPKAPRRGRPAQPR